jgi:hypothetical protein
MLDAALLQYAQSILLSYSWSYDTIYDYSSCKSIIMLHN